MKMTYTGPCPKCGQDIKMSAFGVPPEAAKKPLEVAPGKIQPIDDTPTEPPFHVAIEDVQNVDGMVGYVDMTISCVCGKHARMRVYHDVPPPEKPGRGYKMPEPQTAPPSFREMVLAGIKAGQSTAEATNGAYDALAQIAKRGPVLLDRTAILRLGALNKKALRGRLPNAADEAVIALCKSAGITCEEVLEAARNLP